MLQIHGLIIDKISMVRARLLDDVDRKLRSSHNAAYMFAFDSDRNMRPFAGLKCASQL